MSEKADALRKQIEALVVEYHREQFATRSFIASKAAITPMASSAACHL